MASFALALVVDGGRLCLVPRRWSLLGIPTPAFLLPRGVSFEYEDGGWFHFDVEISAPTVGLIAAYKGSLELDILSGTSLTTKARRSRESADTGSGRYLTYRRYIYL